MFLNVPLVLRLIKDTALDFVGLTHISMLLDVTPLVQLPIEQTMPVLSNALPIIYFKAQYVGLPLKIALVHSFMTQSIISAIAARVHARLA